jgi:two-component SAPR family response regulator
MMPSRAKSIRALPAKVLLVDGHQAGVRARCTILKEQGHIASGVSTPDEALLLMETETFDVIVTEYKLSGTTGPEFIAKLREVAAGTPVILLSGFVDALGLNERSTGADVVLMKSASEASQLTHAVSRLLRMKPMARRIKKKPAASDTEPLRMAPGRTGTHNT